MERIPESSHLNVDEASVDHFGAEWAAFAQDRGWNREQIHNVYESYFAALPHGLLDEQAIVGDFGAGSGRWARIVGPQVGHIYVVEPSSVAMEVARSTLASLTNVSYVQEPIGGPGVPEGALDVAYSIGVLHCVPDVTKALRDIRSALKPGGFLLAYLYYALENRPAWYRGLWRASDSLRRVTSRLSANNKRRLTSVIAATVYWPLARISRTVGRLGMSPQHLPLSAYADKSFYVMRNDALDRFGTPLERRYTRSQIAAMVAASGFDAQTLRFSERPPFWCFSVQAPAG